MSPAVRDQTAREQYIDVHNGCCVWYVCMGLTVIPVIQMGELLRQACDKISSQCAESGL